MRVIGGLVLRDRAGVVSGQLLRAMARAVPGVQDPACAAEGPIGLFATPGLHGLEASANTRAVADLTLANTAELHAQVGARAEDDRRLVTALYGVAGPGLVAWLRGGFALAVWDRRRGELLLAVDRFGIHRLYYARTAEGVAFASRPRALLALAGDGRSVDPTAAYHYFNFGFVPAPASIFSGIRRVPPGHVVHVRDGNPVVRRYWNLEYVERPTDLRAAAVTTMRLTEEAVAACVDGVRPKETGAFLSGGTDSSTVLGLMARLTGGQPHAFSIGFRESGYDELGYAEIAARHFGAAHYTRVLTAGEALDALPRLVEAYDEPFGNDSTLGTFACAKLARDTGVTRLLAGDGGDELFGGNERYRTDRIFGLYGRLPRLLRRGLIEPLLSRLPEGGASPLGRAQRYVRRARIPNPRRFYSYEFFVAQHASDLLAPEFADRVDPEASWAVLQAHFDEVNARRELDRLLYLDLKLTIGDNDLLKVTRTAELAGIEVAFPLLDHPLAEFTATLPARYKVRGLEKRYLFKRAFGNLLPVEVLAKHKHGFGVPVSHWLRRHPGFRQLVGDTLLAPAARVRAYIRPAALERLAALHEQDTTSYYGSLLWTLLMFELWHRRHAEQGSAA